MLRHIIRNIGCVTLIFLLLMKSPGASYHFLNSNKQINVIEALADMEKEEEKKTGRVNDVGIEDYFEDNFIHFSLSPFLAAGYHCSSAHSSALQHIYLDIPTPPPNVGIAS